MDGGRAQAFLSWIAESGKMRWKQDLKKLREDSSPFTAVFARELGFVQELLERNPLLVFGEGEYGVTDIF
ncbi:hypothetical protein ACFX2J_002652 [Malus domestica]